VKKLPNFESNSRRIQANSRREVLLWASPTTFQKRRLSSEASSRLSELGSYHISDVRLLFTVSQTFTIQGRGVTLLPELRPVGDERFKVGDPLRLKRPDGTDELVKIGGIELAKVLNAPCKVLVLLSGKSREDVPIGTEVWSVEP
jgi:hypothetical protein